MNREEMLEALSRLKFVYISPGDWEDVGFTERDIWINSKGYGYLLCDEIDFTWEGEGLGTERWACIQEKIKNETLTYGDIEGTSLADLLESRYSDYDFDDEEELCSNLRSLAELDFPAYYFYAHITDGDVEYYDSEKKLKAAYERDWADVDWDEMPDELLSEWIDRLSIETDPILVEWTKTLNLDSDFCTDETVDIKVDGKIKCYWTAHNTKYFRFSVSVPVFEGSKKRYASLVAEGRDEKELDSSVKFVTRLVFSVRSTRNNMIAYFVVGEDPESEDENSNSQTVERWQAIYELLFTELKNLVNRVVGIDPYAQSLELMEGVRSVIESTALDDRIKQKRITSN